MEVEGYEYQPSDPRRTGCSIIGMAAARKKTQPVPEKVNQERMPSTSPKTRPACPLMATIAATTRK